MLKPSAKPEQPLLIAYLQPASCSYFWLAAGKATSAQQIRQLSTQEAAAFSQQTPARLIMAASCINLFDLELPPGVKASEALLLVEDQLNQPLEDTQDFLLSQTGRQLKLGVLDRQLLTDWQEELAAAGINFHGWLAETSLLEKLWPSEQPLVLTNSATASLEIWLAASASLLKLPLSLLCPALNEASETSNLPAVLAALGVDSEPEIQEVSLVEKIAWLAPGCLEVQEVWPQSWWQKLVFHPKLKQLNSLKNLVSQLSLQLAPYKYRLLPWALSLVCLALAGIFNLMQPQPTDAYFLHTANKFEQQLGLAISHPQANQKFNQQLASLGEHLSYQQNRLNAWQKIHQLLNQHPQAQLLHLQLNPHGLSAQISAPNKASLNQLSQQLTQLGGQLTQQDNQLTWQLSADELDELIY